MNKEYFTTILPYPWLYWGQTSLHIAKILNKFIFESYNSSEDKILPTLLLADEAAYTILVLKFMRLLQRLSRCEAHISNDAQAASELCILHRVWSTYILWARRLVLKLCTCTEAHSSTLLKAEQQENAGYFQYIWCYSRPTEVGRSWTLDPPLD